ncbi:hypothetical protein GCM10027053_18540 [Intrasporangium mesophilum]
MVDVNPVSSQPFPAEFQADVGQGEVGGLDAQSEQKSVVVQLKAMRPKTSVNEDPQGRQEPELERRQVSLALEVFAVVHVAYAS